MAHPEEEEEGLIYLEAGANIGSCVMEMLHSTKAKMIVIEPHPFNLAQLSTTLLAQPKELRDRAALFPIAVGNMTAQSQIFMDKINRGHSTIGVKGESRQGFIDSHYISVEVLDDLFFDTDSPVPSFKIPLMKMDVEGFECRLWKEWIV